MYNLINNNGKILATGSLTKIERLQEHLDPFAVKTAIVEDETSEYVCCSEYDLPVGFHYDDGQSVDELEPIYDGFSAFIIDDMADRVEILQKRDDLLVVRVNDANLRKEIIKNGYEHNGRLYKPAFVGASQTQADCLTLIAEDKYIEHSPDSFSCFVVDDTEWTDDQRKAYEAHPALIQNTHIKNIIQKTCDSRIEKLNCARIPHLDHVHHKSTIDNITILHQVDFPVWID